MVTSVFGSMAVVAVAAGITVVGAVAACDLAMAMAGPVIWLASLAASITRKRLHRIMVFLGGMVT